MKISKALVYLLVILTFVSCGKKEDKKEKKKKDDSTTTTTIYLQEAGGEYDLFSDILTLSNDDDIVLEYILDSTSGENKITATIKYYSGSKYYVLSYLGTYVREGNNLKVTYTDSNGTTDCAVARNALPTQETLELSKGDFDHSYRFDSELNLNFYDKDYHTIRSPYDSISYGGSVSRTQCNILDNLGFFND